jgi:hypothetical protein
LALQHEVQDQEDRINELLNRLERKEQALDEESLLREAAEQEIRRLDALLSRIHAENGSLTRAAQEAEASKREIEGCIVECNKVLVSLQNENAVLKKRLMSGGSGQSYSGSAASALGAGSTTPSAASRSRDDYAVGAQPFGIAGGNAATPDYHRVGRIEVERRIDVEPLGTAQPPSTYRRSEYDSNLAAAAAATPRSSNSNGGSSSAAEAIMNEREMRLLGKRASTPPGGQARSSVSMESSYGRPPSPRDSYNPAAGGYSRAAPSYGSSGANSSARPTVAAVELYPASRSQQHPPPSQHYPAASAAAYAQPVSRNAPHVDPYQDQRNQPTQNPHHEYSSHHAGPAQAAPYGSSQTHSTAPPAPSSAPKNVFRVGDIQIISSTAKGQPQSQPASRQGNISVEVMTTGGRQDQPSGQGTLGRSGSQHNDYQYQPQPSVGGRSGSSGGQRRENPTPPHEVDASLPMPTIPALTPRAQRRQPMPESTFMPPMPSRVGSGSSA